jgi:hypothetical protein
MTLAYPLEHGSEPGNIESLEQAGEVERSPNDFGCSDLLRRADNLSGADDGRTARRYHLVAIVVDLAFSTHRMKWGYYHPSVRTTRN